MLVDSFGRRIRYLRLSVTDRCNLRCVYCLPETFRAFAPPADMMSYEEMLRAAACMAGLGIDHVRLTGGEPLVRPGLAGLVRRLSAISGIGDLSLSTNGILLSSQARELAAAGLGRVNISLDSLDPERFHAITRQGDLKSALEGIEAALREGLHPVKVNVVIARGFNEGEIPDFLRLARDMPVHVRFIELMPMGDTGFFSEERRVPLAEMMERAGALEPLPRELWPAGMGPARCWRGPGHSGTVGFISALSCKFCASCNRLRLSSSGVLYPCLDSMEGADLLPLLRAGARNGTISRVICKTVRRKPEGHGMAERAERPAFSPRLMCRIGG